MPPLPPLPMRRLLHPFLCAISIALISVPDFLPPPLARVSEPCERGLLAFGLRRCLRGGGLHPFRLLLWGCVLLCTLWCAVLTFLSLPATARILHSREPSALWKARTPFETHSLLWLKPGSTATRSAFPCLTFVSDVANYRSASRSGRYRSAMCACLGKYLQLGRGAASLAPALVSPRWGLLVCPAGRPACRGCCRDRGAPAFQHPRSLRTRQGKKYLPGWTCQCCFWTWSWGRLLP